MCRRLSTILLSALALAACVQEADPGAGSDPADKTANKSDMPQAKKPAKAPAAKPSTAPSAAPKGDPLPAKTPPEAPAAFKVEFTTTVGKFTVAATRAWAPNGVDRFHEMVKKGFYNDIAFFRVIPGFMVQFGVHGDPKIAAKWRGANLRDDPVTQSNTRGMMTFATAGPHTRTTQTFINFGNNANLDRTFAPFAKVVEGMAVVDKIYQVGEGAPRGPGPDQGQVQSRGNAYLKQSFPKLDYIQSAKFVE